MRFPVLACLLAFAAAASAATPAVSPVDSDLKYVLILTRHGVRSPLANQATYGKYAAEPWPAWDVPAGHLTPHGRQQMTLMGQYYRERFIRDGLLTGEPNHDRSVVYFRSDSDERTVETARGLGEALVPGTTIDVHARKDEAIDPLFRPVKIPVGHPDTQLGMAAVLGRIGGDPANVQIANRAAIDTLEKILLGEAGTVPPGKVSLWSITPAVGPGMYDHTVGFTGALQLGESMTDVLMLEYAEGMPMEKVGWGRLTEERLTQICELHSLYFELLQGTFYPAQVQSSNLASHILATLQQAATGKPDTRAFGTPDQKVAVIVGHDTNIANLGGLLGLNWWVPGAHRNPVLPGGALMIELRQRRADRRFVVSFSYVSQTFDQMRNLSPLSLAQPPAVAPIFVPGCSTAESGYPAELGRIATLCARVIDPAFTVADPN